VRNLENMQLLILKTPIVITVSQQLSLPGLLILKTPIVITVSQQLSLQRRTKIGAPWLHVKELQL
jgi:hypothetical protein